MRIKKGFNIRQVGDENIIIASGYENIDFTKIISLNKSAARLWKEIDGNEFTADQLTKLLLEWYEVDEETAINDIRLLIESWLKAGIIEE